MYLQCYNFDLIIKYSPNAIIESLSGYDKQSKPKSFRTKPSMGPLPAEIQFSWQGRGLSTILYTIYLYVMISSYGNYVYSFQKLPNCFPKYLHHFVLSPVVYGAYDFSTFKSALVLSDFFFILAVLVSI